MSEPNLSPASRAQRETRFQSAHMAGDTVALEELLGDFQQRAQAASGANSEEMRSLAEELGDWRALAERADDEELEARLRRLGNLLEARASHAMDMERLAALSSRDREAVEAVLDGQASYDDLPGGEPQDVVRQVWRTRIAEGLATLDFRPELEASGLPWAEADRDGNVVWRGPGTATP